MHNVQEIMTKIIREQPEDASYEKIMRELAFERMVEKGLEDSRKGKIISNEEMEQRIRRNSRGIRAAKPVNSRGHVKRSALQRILKFHSCKIMSFKAIYA
ncbi:MAG TPA: hypothetical protein VJ440_09325 [Candidatus Brocadiaceae bacterium]|nr:hypothetical protein [Candidatus Brocadiaceae bacterium]